MQWLAAAAPGDMVPIPNADFERPAAATPGADSLPDQWNEYQWGMTGGRYRSVPEAGAGRGGSIGVRAENLDASAKAGVYTHIDLAAGTYRLTVWARAQPGQKAKVALYLATVYSRPLTVTDQWTQVSFENTLDVATPKAEINIQNASGRANVVWFDDVSLQEVKTVHGELVPDTRRERPRTLMFSPMNVNYLRATAPAWAARGFRGFLFDGVMGSWDTDVWAVDGDAKSRDESDGLLREVRDCNRACRRVGIDSNFVKVAYYSDLPDWFDDTAWARVTRNFREGARFSRLAECAGMAIDTEYTAPQYNPDWPGYAAHKHPLNEMKQQVRRRFHDVVAAMLQEFPDMPLLTLPEGTMYYGELYQDMLSGMFEAMAEKQAPGGLHVMTEGTYHLLEPSALARYARDLQDTLLEELPPQYADYWKRRCSIALGAWPLGYYRQIFDAAGKDLGYGGKQEIYGDKIIGSYGDKSAWYSPADFARQMAGLNAFSTRYNWIYAHGAVFWQWSDAEQRQYTAGAHKTASNATLPTAPNLNAYFAVIAKPQLVVLR
jgi:hypothetical protein